MQAKSRSTSNASTAGRGSEGPRLPRRLIVHGLSLVLTLVGAPEILAQKSAPPAPIAPADGHKLFEKHCFECHADGMDKGSFALDSLLQAGASETNRPSWTKAWTLVRHGFMPPANADPMSEGDRKAVAQWMEQRRLGVDYRRPDPGRVTIRRLNRMEYDYTIQDLFGVSPVFEGDFSSDGGATRIRLRDMLPPDDTAFGFDNNGDFQTLSPALLEKYFNIAEFVVDNVVAQDGPRYPLRQLDPEKLRITRSKEGAKTAHETEFEVAHPGRYRVEAQFALGGWREFGGAYDFTMAVDGQPLTKEAIEVGGYKSHRYGKEVTLAKGAHRLLVSTDATKAGADGKLAHLELKPALRIAGPIGGDIHEYPEAHRRIFFEGDAPADPSKRRDYARRIMQRVADRAFRRPASEAVVTRLAELVMRAPKFEGGVGLGLMAILTSPQFIFRSEVQPQPDDPKAIHPLDEFALASRLSYFLWLSLPDDELAALAKRGQLRKNLPAQLKRMLADTKSERFFEDFPGQWLRTRNVLMTPVAADGEINPVREAMKRETELLFEHIARHDRDLLELVTADYTFVDAGLAKYYGLKNFSGEGYQKIGLPPETKRGGVLGHGSFLVGTSNPNRTSPVKRGVFVLENLLAIHPPPPPPTVPSLDDVKPGMAVAKTGSDLLALHRAEKSCAACHAHFDPIGVALENFDLRARWRTSEGGVEIAPKEKTVTGQTLTGINDLKKFFTDRKRQFYLAATEKLMTYSLGRGLDPGDAFIVDGIADKVAADGGKFSTLLLALVESSQFQTRRGDDGAVKTPPRTMLPEAPPVEQRKGRKKGGRPFTAGKAASTNEVEVPAVERKNGK